MTRTAVSLSALAALVVAGWLLAVHAQEMTATGGWSRFEGSWSAAGQRQTLPTEGDRPAAIVSVSGAIVLTKADGLVRGFRGEAIGYDDGRGAIGRSTWTDDRGDRIFSELKGEPVHTGRRIVGRFTGGTGRYAGMTGDYELTWQYVVHAEDGVMQAATVALKGRFRLAGVRK